MSETEEERCVLKDPRLDMFDGVVVTYVQPTITVFGTIGNVLLLFTIYYGRFKNSSYIYIAAITIGTLVACLSYQDIVWARCSTQKHVTTMWQTIVVYKRLLFFAISVVLLVFATYATIVLTLERYLFVRHTEKAQSLCTRRIAKRVCLVLFLMAWFRQVINMWDYKLSTKGYRNHPFLNSLYTFNCLLQTPYDNNSSYLCSWDIPIASSLQDYCRVGDMWYIPSQDLDGSNQTEKHVEITINQNRNSSTTLNLIYKTGEFSNISSSHVSEVCGISFDIEKRCTMLLSRSCDLLSESYLEFHKKLYHEARRTFVIERTPVEWYEKNLSLYFGIQDGMFGFSSVILTVLSVLLLHAVYRNSRNSSAGQDRDEYERKNAENRLSISIVVFAAVRGITMLTIITAVMITPTIFGKDFTRSSAYQINYIIVQIVGLFDLAYSFYILVFIDTEFRKEFIKQIKKRSVLLLSSIDESLKKLRSSSQQEQVTSEEGATNGAFNSSSEPTDVPMNAISTIASSPGNTGANSPEI